MSNPPARTSPRLFGRGSWAEVSRIVDILRTQTVGGLLLVGAALVGLLLANSPSAGTYEALSDTRIGPAPHYRSPPPSAVWSSPR